MITVYTKYQGQTDSRPARIKATLASCSDAFKPGYVAVSIDPGLSNLDNHKAALAKLLDALGLHGTFATGESHDGRGYAFVQLPAYDDAFAL